MNARDLERLVFRILPACVLLVAFAGLCVMTGTVWPWNHVVHEDGSRTLLATVFYFEHATRELVPDAVLAIAVAGGVRYYFPPVLASGSAQASQRRAWLGVLTVVLLVAVIGGTLWTAGNHALTENLSQSHTRAGAPLVWGAHWRYHLIERFAQVMLAFSVSGLIWMLRGRPDVRQAPGRFKVYGAALLLFAGITLVFNVTPEPFRDPAFLGHQLRELFTHALVTLPLALGTCLALARSYSDTSPVSSTRTLDPGLWTRGSAWPIILTASAALLSGTFLLVASLLADAQSHGQTTGLAALLLPHFAEHSLGYISVPALAGLIYLAPDRAGGGTKVR